MAGNDQELTNAYRRRSVVYPDYKPTQDFGVWMGGLREKIRSAFGFTLGQEEEVDAEVILTIAGRLQVGGSFRCVPPPYRRRKR